MCDYSLQAFKSRPAQVGDKLIVHNFGAGTTGFADGSQVLERRDTAICLLPGTEIAIEPAVTAAKGWVTKVMDVLAPEAPSYKTAIFRQVDKENKHAHHDMLEFPDGSTCKLTLMPLGVVATVLQLPAKPKNEAEREEQRRAEFV